MGKHHGSDMVGGTGHKITKSKSVVVKPFLKRLSHSEKNSLDLDRWDDQSQMAEWEGGDDGAFGGGGNLYYPATGIDTFKSARDVSFEIVGRSSLSIVREGAASDAGGSGRRTFQHGRTPSGNSYVSLATNSTSGGVRVGTFVHPFQQLPRTSTSTPPLTYAGSMASFDNGSGPQRDHSPTITENEDDDDAQEGSQSVLNLAGSSLSNHTTSSNIHPHYHGSASYSQPSPASAAAAAPRPSLASQRAMSQPDVTSGSPNLRMNSTGRSTPTAPSRLASNKSDLHLNLSSLESPTGSIKASSKPTLKTAKTSPSIVSPTASSATPMSPLRTSLDMMGIPRLRSHSEVDTAARQEQLRRARRKFEQRERAKEEKYDLEQVRKRNRKETKEASRIEKERQEWYRATGVSSSSVGAGVCVSMGSVNNSKATLSSSLAGTTILETSTATSGRTSMSRKPTPTTFSTLSSSASAPVTSSRSSGGGSKISRGKRQGSFPGADRPGHSSAGLYDITTIRKSHGFARGDFTPDGDAEKRQMFAASNYDSVPGQMPPMFGDDALDEETYPFPKMPSKKTQAKRKTQSAWHGLVMWIRAKMLRISGR